MKKGITLLIYLLAFALTATALPAYRGTVIRTAPDGTEKQVFLHGNEDFHYMTDAAGQWLDEETLEPLTDTQKNARLVARNTNRLRRNPQNTQDIGGKPNASPRGLLVLVNFRDVQFSTPNAEIDSMLNGKNYTRDYTYAVSYQGRTTTRHIKSSGSVQKYFEDQSYGAYSPAFDVVGPVTLSREMAYYGENNSGGDDMRASDMIQEACKLADTQFGVDFTLYDNDNDGFVDFVYVIYAGFGEADGGETNTVWPHQWNLWDYGRISCYVDNIRLNRYACGPELSFTTKQHAGIGTICHEFSHVLGLPDLYITSDASHRTLEDWDIMDYGPYNNEGNTPPAYSAYERFYMGWLQPRILDQPEYVTLQPLNNGQGESLLICEENSHNLIGWNPNPKTFYLLESRIKEGWDLYLPGRGLIITRIAYNRSKWAYNIVNNDPDDMGVDMMEARKTARKYGSSTDAFPAGARQWSPDNLTDKDITGIRIATGGAVEFSYRNAPEPQQGFEQVHYNNSDCCKTLRNGQIVIIRNGVMYDLNGRTL